jgi:hypothetical protein
MDKTFKQFLAELAQPKRSSSDDEIESIERAEKPVSDIDKDAEYATHHVVWTNSGKGYMIHTNQIHSSFGGKGAAGSLKVGDKVDPSKHKLFHDPADDKD